MKSIIMVAAIMAMAAGMVSASIDYKRVHLVDVAQRTTGGYNYLYRGNMPTNGTTFAYDTMIQYMGQRAKDAGYSFPSQAPYLIIISLNNIFDGADFEHEQQFWKHANASLGEFHNWPLGVAGVLPPNWFPEDTRRAMAITGGAAWMVDELPKRIPQIRTFLNTTRDRPVAIYVHCSAGCDRTGEVIGAYRTSFQTQNLTRMYELSCSECGRPPNYFGSTALEWYCYWYTYTYGRSIGNCTGFAKCKMFGHCEPTNGTMSDIEPIVLPTNMSPIYKMPAIAFDDVTIDHMHDVIPNNGAR